MDTKERVLVLFQYLKNNTDEDTAVSAANIRQMFKEKGESISLPTLRDDIASLQKAGCDIDISEEKGIGMFYKYLSREWSMPELQVLVDAVSAAQFGLLPFLPQVPVHAVLLDRHPEHPRSGGAVDVPAVPEDLRSPRLAREVREHPRLDGGKIRHDELATRPRYERRADEFREHLAELRGFADERENLSVDVSGTSDLRGMQIQIHGDRYAVISKNRSSAVHFVVRQKRFIRVLETLLAGAETPGRDT